MIEKIEHKLDILKFYNRYKNNKDKMNEINATLRSTNNKIEHCSCDQERRRHLYTKRYLINLKKEVQK